MQLFPVQNFQGRSGYVNLDRLSVAVQVTDDPPVSNGSFDITDGFNAVFEPDTETAQAGFNVATLTDATTGEVKAVSGTNLIGIFENPGGTTYVILGTGVPFIAAGSLETNKALFDAVAGTLVGSGFFDFNVTSSGSATVAAFGLPATWSGNTNAIRMSCAIVITLNDANPVAETITVSAQGGQPRAPVGLPTVGMFGSCVGQVFTQGVPGSNPFDNLGLACDPVDTLGEWRCTLTADAGQAADEMGIVLVWDLVPTV